LKTRTFAEIGDASWLLSLVEECLNCRHAYDRQDMLDMIKRNDNISHCEIRDSQCILISALYHRPGGFLRVDFSPGILGISGMLTTS